MRQHETREVMRRPDGSVDTPHYMGIAREERSRKAHDMARKAVGDRDGRPALLRILRALRT